MSVMIVCLSLLALSIWYVPARLKKLMGWRRTWPGHLAALLLVAGFPLLLMSGAYTSSSPLLGTVYNVFGLAFMFHVCLLLLLLLAHLLSRPLKKISGRRIAAASLVLSLIYVGSGFVQAQNFSVTSHDLPIKGLPGPVKIAHLPDLHLGAQRDEAYLSKVIEAVNAQNPDFILFNGDLVDSDIAVRPELFSLFKNFKAPGYFTTGNHEFYVNTPRALELIGNAGLEILRNRMVETHGLQLIGLEYMSADRMTYDSHMVNDLTIEEELPKISRDPQKPTLLAHHSPVGLQYVTRGGIDLMLSGHTHGGQLFPGTWLARLTYPLVKGLHQIDDTWFLVSQGAGTFGPWMRLGTFNEIQIITLRPAE